MDAPTRESLEQAKESLEERLLYVMPKHDEALLHLSLNRFTVNQIIDAIRWALDEGLPAVDKLKEAEFACRHWIEQAAESAGDAIQLQGRCDELRADNERLQRERAELKDLKKSVRALTVTLVAACRCSGEPPCKACTRLLKVHDVVHPLDERVLESRERFLTEIGRHVQERASQEQEPPAGP